MAKCIVCGCTDEYACDGGCEWIISEPPLCSSCVAKFFIAKLWAFMTAAQKNGSAELSTAIRECVTVYSFISADRAEELGIPTIAQINQINRRRIAREINAAKPAPKPAPKKARAGS